MFVVNFIYFIYISIKIYTKKSFYLLLKPDCMTKPFRKYLKTDHVPFAIEIITFKQVTKYDHKLCNYNIKNYYVRCDLLKELNFMNLSRNCKYF